MDARPVRVVGALVVLALLGAGAGFALGPDGAEPTSVTRFATAEPVPAERPALPVEIFRADPDDPALETAIDLREIRLRPLAADGTPIGTQLLLPVPEGWVETRPTLTRWQFVPPDNDALGYGMRVDVLADTGLTLDAARQARESQLRSALYQESFSSLEITEDRADGFTAVYVQDGYQRYTIERFYPGPDPDLAFATVAVYGRARDVTGLGDLLERISIGLRTPSAP